MKKSELRNIIREIISEQYNNPDNPVVFFDPEVFQCPEGQITNMDTQNGLCQDPQTWYSANEAVFSLPGGGFPNADNIFLTQCCTNETFNASCPEGQTLIQVGQVAGPEPPQPGNQGPVDQEYVDMCADPNSWYNNIYDMFSGNINPNMNLEATYQNGCCKPLATTGCDGFINLSQEFQDSICALCENPNYVSVHCECCPEQEEPPTPQAQAVPTTPPSPKKTKKDPQVDRMQKLAKIKEIINLS
tara:strand:- start:167 stop:901 length:735 start_codon:yes stop_codon:yes gene_type:complete